MGLEVCRDAEILKAAAVLGPGSWLACRRPKVSRKCLPGVGASRPAAMLNTLCPISIIYFSAV